MLPRLVLSDCLHIPKTLPSIQACGQRDSKRTLQQLGKAGHMEWQQSETLVRLNLDGM